MGRREYLLEPCGVVNYLGSVSSCPLVAQYMHLLALSGVNLTYDIGNSAGIDYISVAAFDHLISAHVAFFKNAVRCCPLMVSKNVFEATLVVLC